MPDRSRLQRLRACAFFPITLSIPPSLSRDPSCLAAPPSNSKLLAPLCQHGSNQVPMHSPELRLKSFHVSHSSHRDRDQVTISGFCSHDGPGSSSSIMGWTDFFVYFFFCIGMTDTSMCSFSGLAAVSVTGIQLAAVPIVGPAFQNPLVVFHMCSERTQDKLLHNLAQHRGQAERPVVPAILLPTLLVGGHHTGKPPVV